MKRKLLTYLLLIVAGVSVAQPKPACFQPAANYGRSSPIAIESADFNGDGHADLVVSKYNNSMISVSLGDGSGTFTSTADYSVGSSPGDIIAVDLNGDGNIDLAVSCWGSSCISVLKGTGTGAFNAVVNFPTGSYPEQISAADFNGDGKIDLAVARYYSSSVAVLLGSGTGSFGGAVNFAVGLNPFSTCAGDFNGDGKPDLAVTNEGTNNISVLLSTGSGAFGPAVNYAVGTHPFNILCADFNGDAVPDLAVANENSFSISILTGVGDGSFTQQINYFAQEPGSGTLADFNKDGNIDLAHTNWGNGKISVMMGAGDGSFSLPLFFPTGTNPRGICQGDFNGDGKADLGVANLNSNNISILIGLPILAVSNASYICAGESVLLSATGAETYFWSNGSSDSSIVVTPTVTRNYTVTGTNSQGCTASAVIAVSVDGCTGIDVNSSAGVLFDFYPNPGQGIFFIKSENMVGATLNICNLTGGLIRSYVITQDIFQIDISDCSDGIYLAEIKNTRTARKMLIKQ